MSEHLWWMIFMLIIGTITWTYQYIQYRREVRNESDQRCNGIKRMEPKKACRRNLQDRKSTRLNSSH